ncbi:hypothetical protein ACVPOQ_06130 [Staphylococcus aureus]
MLIILAGSMFRTQIGYPAQSEKDSFTRKDQLLDANSAMSVASRNNVITNLYVLLLQQ